MRLDDDAKGAWLLDDERRCSFSMGFSLWCTIWFQRAHLASVVGLHLGRCFYGPLTARYHYHRYQGVKGIRARRGDA